MKTDAAPASGLTFDWPRRGGFSFLFSGCVVLSLLAHVATFFLFQVSDPPGTSIPRTAPTVSVLTPSSPEAIALLHWIDAQDPALVATANSITPPGIYDIAYTPSYATMRTAPLGPAEPVVIVPFPSAREPLAIITSADPQPLLPTTVSEPHPTTFLFTSSLATRAPASLPTYAWKSRTSTPVQPSQFLIAVTDRGEVRFVFPQGVPDNPALESEAAAYLQTLTFAPSDRPITWATATVSWGDDAYAANQTAAIKPQTSP
jgi:hypothetical protein